MSIIKSTKMFTMGNNKSECRGVKYRPSHSQDVSSNNITTGRELNKINPNKSSHEVVLNFNGVENSHRSTPLISGERTSSKGAKEISFTNLLEGFNLLIKYPQDDQKVKDTYSWLMVNKRGIRIYLQNESKEITNIIKELGKETRLIDGKIKKASKTKVKSLIKRKNELPNIKKSYIRDRTIIQYMTSALTTLERNVTLEFDYDIQYHHVVRDEIFKFKISGYEIYRGLFDVELLTNKSSSNNQATSKMSDKSKIWILFRIAVFSLPIRNPSVGITLPMMECWRALGWMNGYSDDIIRMCGLNSNTYKKLDMNKQLVTLADAVFDCGSECRCLLNTNNNTFIKEGNDLWNSFGMNNIK